MVFGETEWSRSPHWLHRFQASIKLLNRYKLYEEKSTKINETCENDICQYQNKNSDRGLHLKRTEGKKNSWGKESPYLLQYWSEKISKKERDVGPQNHSDKVSGKDLRELGIWKLDTRSQEQKQNETCLL